MSAEPTSSLSSLAPLRGLFFAIFDSIFLSQYIPIFDGVKSNGCGGGRNISYLSFPSSFSNSWQSIENKKYHRTSLLPPVPLIVPRFGGGGGLSLFFPWKISPHWLFGKIKGNEKISSRSPLLVTNSRQVSKMKKSFITASMFSPLSPRGPIFLP